MTAKKRTARGKPERKPLSVRKETLKDLNPPKGKGQKVRGGGTDPTRTCPARY